MRYRVVVLMLLLLLVGTPIIYLPAAPAPEPVHGILDIGPPPKGKTAEEHLKFQMQSKTDGFTWYGVTQDPEVMNLPSVAPLEDARPWLENNLRVTSEGGGRRLRFTFRAGKRNEQVTIINAFLRSRISLHQGGSLKLCEECLERAEKGILDLEQRIESGQFPHMVDKYQEGIKHLRFTYIPECHANIAYLKQYAVIRWAR